MFNVVTDQLKVSQGWVRCGQCAEVFDATLHLQPHAEAVQKELPTAETQQPEPLLSSVSMANTNDSAYAEQATAILITPEEKPDPVVTHGVVALTSDTTDPTAVDQQDDALSDFTSDASSDVSFVRDARRQAFWRKPLLRAGLSLVAILLTGTLVLQLAIMQRDSLAAFDSRLKPWLQLLCEQMACNLGPVRQIEAIVIDSSSFNKISEPAVYRLNFSLKNNGTVAVAMPSVEVTLTDTQDQVVLRRVLSPSQFGAANDTLAAKADFPSGLNLQIVSGATSAEPLTPANEPVRVAGYRLLAFYP